MAETPAGQDDQAATIVREEEARYLTVELAKTDPALGKALLALRGRKMSWADMLEHLRLAQSEH